MPTIAERGRSMIKHPVRGIISLLLMLFVAVVAFRIGQDSAAKSEAIAHCVTEGPLQEFLSTRTFSCRVKGGGAMAINAAQVTPDRIKECIEPGVIH